MPSNTSTDTAAINTQQGQSNIHALFRKSQFLGDIDYDTVFRGPAILATRLLDSPQALHWVYAFLYGVNTHTDVPVGWIPPWSTKPLKGEDIPKQYACNKAVGQLSAGDIEDVRKALDALAHKCHFEVRDLRVHILGRTAPADVNKGYAIITIGDEVYRRALFRVSHNVFENALIDLELSIIMLHEVAHALNLYYMGKHEEGFFEDSLVAEHGFELESRLFGLCPCFVKTNLALWYPWQTRLLFASGSYKADFICRQQEKPPEDFSAMPLDPSFAIKLCRDEFWEGEYLQQGAVALIPDQVKTLCRERKDDILTKAIPQSIWELLRDDINPNQMSYAEKRYAEFEKPLSGFRKPLLTNEGDESEAEDGTDTIPDTDVEWSEGEGFDASGYNTEDEEMTDVSDDDTTIRGDFDDEMTEVEEWEPRVKLLIFQVEAAEMQGCDSEAELRVVKWCSEMRELREMEEVEDGYLSSTHK